MSGTVSWHERYCLLGGRKPSDAVREALQLLRGFPYINFVERVEGVMRDRESHSCENEDLKTDRRKFLEDAGRFAGAIPPTMVVLLSTTMSSSAIAQSGSVFTKGNNGVGNGVDGQPPGNPPINDGPGTGKGNPGH